MTVTEGNRKCVSRIRLRVRLQAQQDFYHVLYLLFIRVTSPDGSLFDLVCRIFVDRQVSFGAGGYGTAPCLAQLEGRICISVHENLFNGNFIRTEIADQAVKLAEKEPEFHGSIFSLQINPAMGHMTGMVAVHVNNTVAGMA